MSAAGRVLLDANVLMPSILRRLLLGAAARGAFAPLWSERILEEWARATRKLPLGAEAEARAEIAALRARWPEAEVPAAPELEETLALPDAADRHVLASAIAGRADTLLTSNRADFPSRTLARHGVLLREPDGFLCELASSGSAVAAAAEALRAEASERAERRVALRATLKRAGLPRLGKALDPAAGPGGQTATETG